MQVEFILLGASPLLHHSPIMVDPEFHINRKIKAITCKKKKTDEDHKLIEELEWHGGLYTAMVDGRMCVTQPCSKVRKCLIGAARISKQGKQVERAINMTGLNAPLLYDGSDKVKDFDAEIVRLFNDKSFHSRLSVVIGGKRVMRIRPQFCQWALVVEAEYFPDSGLNFDELQRIVKLAGKTEGIGDNRVNGYGRFRGHVREVTARTVPIRLSLSAVSDFFDSLEEKEDAA